MHTDPFSQAGLVKFARVVAYLLELIGAKFYGDVTIKFRNGQITLVTKVETFQDDVPVKDGSAVRIMETAGRLEVAAGK